MQNDCRTKYDLALEELIPPLASAWSGRNFDDYHKTAMAAVHEAELREGVLQAIAGVRLLDRLHFFVRRPGYVLPYLARIRRLDPSVRRAFGFEP